MKTKEQLVDLGLPEFKAEEILRLEDMMMETAVRFQFKKKDNSVREANGTLERAKMIQEDGTEWTPLGESKPEPANIVRYWDLDAKNWRSFDITRFIGVCA